ncbi:hypothetical protein [Wenyingzhuangia sp. 2_MG-2023]|uniref:hypothetical protein n=1 Tax=Wenyingzhuangia sp. 2_MG-2023 TaxID=3062639 RepID=UPI0026E2ACFB|nr:hypothetical protein [Wenyingzhuangia sp. 2_MG-2023]MDO6736340.1 hypothetical protein [Wenyingzhuangia sp. 2_MG-2023]
MKNLRKIIKYLFLTLLVVSCQNEEYEAPNTFTDVIFTSTFAGGVKESEVNKFATFMDLSAGATHHEWRIPKGAFFLKGPLQVGSTSYDKSIINPGDTVSTDRTVNVLFKKGNTITPITIYNEFDEYTEFVLPVGWDAVANQQILDTTRTVKKGDKWVYEYTTVLDVYDTVVAVAEIRDLAANVIDYKNLDTIRLKFDDKLVFEDLSAKLPDNNARPTTTSWKIYTITDDIKNRVSIASGNTTIDTLTFSKSIGTFKGELKATRDRTETVGSSTDTYVFPVIFKVEPLDEDFVLKGNIVEGPTDIIEFIGSSKFVTFGNEALAGFDLKVDGVSRSIASVSQPAGNLTKINIVLETPLEPSDATKTVTLSYDSTVAGLTSLDLRPFQSFTDVAVQVYVPTPIGVVGTIKKYGGEEMISLKLDEGVDPLSITNSDDATKGFEVTVNGVSTSVVSVTLSEDDDKLLNIELADPIYDNDAIQISYSAIGDITSIGGGALAEIPLQNVENVGIDVLGGKGAFNNEIGVDWSSTSGKVGGVDIAFAEIVSNPPAGGTVVPTGNVFRSTINIDDPMSTSTTNAKLKTISSLKMERDVTYKISFKRYIGSNPDNANSAGNLVFRFETGSIRKDASFSVLKGDPTKLDQWLESEITFVGDNDAIGETTSLTILPTWSAYANFYIDDLVIEKYSERP